ncbi:MAG: multiubiquitin domain-containing protein [Deltaproteobacteria bacterium]|nr:multiubiquitin domain-containing protein [Deltaproteobacteria bacterium]
MANSNEHIAQDHGTPIVVNGRPKKWAGETITFEQVVNLAFPHAPPNPNTVYTVTYKKGGDQGSLVAGGSIAVKPGTIFNVTATDKS